MTIEMIEAAPDELANLAVAMRPGWDRDEFSLALVAARNAGWSWKRTLLATAQLLCDPKGFPHHLKAAAARPFERTEPEPGAEVRGAALARELMGKRGAA